MSVYSSLEPATSTVVPGAAAATLTLMVRNNTDQVEEYQLSAVGPLSRWTELSPERLRIFPATEGTTTVMVTVPRTSDALAGPTPLGIRVVPKVNPQLADVAECTITVTPFGELRAEMNPVTVRGRLSRFVRISVENRGNSPLHVNLSGKDDEDVLRFDKGGLDTVVVPAGQVVRPLLRVRSVRRRLLARQKRYPFAVTVSPTAQETTTGALPAELRGTYVQRALLSKWVVLLLLLVLVAALLYYLLPLVQNRTFAVQLPPAAVGAPAQQGPPPQGAPPQGAPPQGQEGQEGEQRGDDQNLVVTITQGNTALAAIVGARGDGGPAPLLRPATRGEREQVWHLLRLENGSVAIVPAAAADNVLVQPNPTDDSQLGLTRIGGTEVSQDQTWELRSVDESRVAIINSETGDCMTSAGNGRAVQGAECTDEQAGEQLWQLTRS